jgi:hypothetical protein
VKKLPKCAKPNFLTNIKIVLLLWQKVTKNLDNSVIKKTAQRKCAQSGHPEHKLALTNRKQHFSLAHSQRTTSRVL